MVALGCRLNTVGLPQHETYMGLLLLGLGSLLHQWLTDRSLPTTSGAIYTPFLSCLQLLKDSNPTHQLKTTDRQYNHSIYLCLGWQAGLC